MGEKACICFIQQHWIFLSVIVIEHISKTKVANLRLSIRYIIKTFECAHAKLA
jgi:hypothetical protein